MMDTLEAIDELGKADPLCLERTGVEDVFIGMTTSTNGFHVDVHNAKNHFFVLSFNLWCQLL